MPENNPFLFSVVQLLEGCIIPWIIYKRPLWEGRFGFGGSHATASGSICYLAQIILVDRFSGRSHHVALCFVAKNVSLAQEFSFHLRHKMHSVQEVPCAPFGSQDLGPSQQKWPWPAVCQTWWLSVSPVPSRLPRLQDGEKATTEFLSGTYQSLLNTRDYNAVK